MSLVGRPTKFDKVVKREVCQVTTKGVRYATFQDQAGAESAFRADASYLFAVTDKVRCRHDIFCLKLQNSHVHEFSSLSQAWSQGFSEVGVCFIDTTIGTFYVGQFQDDRHFSRLRTIFSHFSPAEVIERHDNCTK